MANLRLAAEALRIHSAWAISWFWWKSVLIPPAMRKAVPPEILHAHLVESIQATLYENYYCQGRATPFQKPSRPATLLSTKAAFVREMCVANQGAGFLEDGWGIVRREGDKLIVSKDGVTLALNETEYVMERTGGATGQATVALRMPKEIPAWFPGYVTMFGNHNLVWNEDQDVLRLYWNITPPGAPILIRQISRTLNESGIPFRLKALEDPAQYTRCDAAVLYCYKSDYETLRPCLERIYPSLDSCLRLETPAFTKPLAPGLGLAEDPRKTTSFGMHRCYLLADGLVRAHREKQKSWSARLELIRLTFKLAGVDIDRPFLNRGSRDDYSFADQPRRGSKHRKRGAARDPSGTNSFLQTAHDIGEQIAAKALWHGSRCNWMAMGAASTPQEGTASTQVFGALGPDLYAGTAGIALFLAELSIVTGNTGLRRVALGSIRQSLAGASALALRGRFGLYDGVSGVALIAAYLSRRLDEEALLDESRFLLQDAFPQSELAQPMDMLSGRAGAIVALASLARLLEDADLLGVADKMGAQLIKAADYRDGACSWRSSTPHQQRNLTGLSHGTAGIACALLELYQATGDKHWRQEAEMAFDYERFCYVPEMRNWPDFRGVPPRARLTDRLLEFPAFWCHGAGGIALSRMRAWALLGNERFKEEALTALQTTLEYTAQLRASGRMGFSLCHGLSGNADILLDGFRQFGQPCHHGADLAREIALAGLLSGASGKRVRPWTGDRLAPGFMLGTSGIGYFYLRLQDELLPSFLLVEPNAILRRTPARSIRSEPAPAHAQR